jgi:hypothetical protein
MTQTSRVSLVVLAAGMGSRYGGLKQMDAFGPHGETIIDYSLYDAIAAGFNHVVFIIRKSFAEEFKAAFGPKLEGRVAVDYVYQELDNLPVAFDVPDGRDRPWGTGHAIWVAHEVVQGPFGVINADDFYGRESYVTLYEFLTTPRVKEVYGVVGYKLANTLSEHGTVNRGVCKQDDMGFLAGIEECKGIGRTDNDVILYTSDDGHEIILPEDTLVSMNMWGFYPSYFTYFEGEFAAFLQAHGQELKSEYYIPTLVDHLLHAGERKTKVLVCDAEWFGVTYREDKPFVSERLERLILAGVYPQRLWG